jgi:glycosyltransferase involved in cell wall biosynthesis
MIKQKKKVLIITYYWPPSGGIGVLRCLKIAKYLRDFGWEPLIYTAENPHYPSIDHSNDKDIPADITVLKGKIWEPYAIYKMITGKKKDANVNNVFYVNEEKVGFLHHLSVWIRSNFFIPDARALWIKPSVKFLAEYLAKHPVDALLTDGPPHSNTRIATLLKQKTGTPWLADFQDPWTQVDYYQLLNLTPWANRKHHRLEQEAFEVADKTTIVSRTWKQDLESIGAKNVSVINWGFDPEDFVFNTYEVAPRFSLVHAGIMGPDRNPLTFFKVLNKLKEEIPGFASDLELKLIGQVAHEVKQALNKYQLMENTKLTGSLPRQEALQLICSAPILLLLLNQQKNAAGRIPGKFFEYLAAKRPILNFGPAKSDVQAILSKTKGGVNCTYTDKDAIRSNILRLYEQYKSGQLNTPLDTDISAYSIKNLTGQIAGFLDEISST